MNPAVIDDVLQSHVPISLRWEHASKQRYYHLVLSRDLFGEWLLTKAWGGINQSSGRVISVHCDSETKGKLLIMHLIKLRLRRGYTLKSLRQSSSS